MHGNVWEWVQDRDEDDDSKRVGRGGSFKSDAQSVDSDHHSSADPDTRNDQVGFRLLRDGEAKRIPWREEATLPLGDKNITVVRVEPGVFQMGEPNGQHEVEISKVFWLGKHEVTQGQWEAVMGTTPWAGKANVQLDPSYPATYISWEDVQEFIARLNEAAGDEWEWRYRLPTEAEWEYACRAGTPTEWSFGDEESDLEYYAWYNANTKEYPQMVYWKRANPWGLYDMHGNVAEWVQDWYDPSSPDEDPRKRVTRGGAFNGSYEDTRSASRSAEYPDTGNAYTGVRLVLYKLENPEELAAAPLEETFELLGGAEMAMMWIEPGVFQFQMGAPNGPREVEISEGFWLGTHEVTQGQWEAVMGMTDWSEPWVGQDSVQSHESRPAVYISWEDVQEFIARLNEAAGERRYRLPTEAEWEYACRAGTQTAWSFGDDEDQLEHYAWYGDYTAAQEVGLKRANPWGLHDMHGNVREWVQDRRGSHGSYSYYEDPLRSVRGGAFNLDNPRSLRSLSTRGAWPNTRGANIGFRLVRDETPQEPTTRTVSLPEGPSMEMVWVEPGMFLMGSKEEDGQEIERPEHEVEISKGFWLGMYEVTQEQWEAVMETTPWSGVISSNPSYPAVKISWEDVQAFIDTLNVQAGERRYRLPTEAEWEYACRAGMPTRWSFGDDERRLEYYAWYRENATSVKAVGQTRANAWGLYDMHGNVWEWVQDGCCRSYDRSSHIDPLGPDTDTGAGRIARGGGYANSAGRLRSAHRSSFPHDTGEVSRGFRLLMVEEPEALPVEEPEEAPPASSELQTPEEARSALDEQGIDFTKDAFFAYSEGGDVSVVRLFIAAGMDINESDLRGRTALMFAALEGHVDVVRLLLEHGADIHAQNNTALSFAAYENHVEVMRLLIEHGIEHGQTPEEVLNVLSEQGIHLELTTDIFVLYVGTGNVFRMWLSILGGIDINAQGNDGWTALTYAAWLEHWEIMWFLLEHGADINAQNDDGGTALMYAAQEDTVEVMRLLLEHGADIHAQDNQGDTALMQAAWRGHVEVVRLLLEHGADIHVQNNQGYTALMRAARSRDAEVVRLLLEHGADIHVQNNRGETALMPAAWSNAVEVVRLLLEHGADIHAQDNQGYTALMHAARGSGGNAVEVVRLLLEHGADIHAQDNQGETALMQAANLEYWEVMRFLLEHGADINAQDIRGYTALMYAAWWEDVEVVRFLLEHGADINVQNNTGETALSVAKREGHQEVIDLLEALSVEEPEEAPPASSELQTPEEARSALDEQGIDFTKDAFFAYSRAGDVSVVRLFIAAGMDISPQDNYGRTALMLAAWEGHVDVVRFLLEHGADIHARDNYGWTVLMLARDSGVDVVRLLLEHGADIHAQHNGGATAVMIAAAGGDVEVVRLLLEHGADIHAQSNSGATAVMSAARYGHMEVVRLLLAHGADINAQNNNGATAVMYAAEEGYVEVVRLLLDHGADVNAQDDDGETALSLAKREGYQEVIDLLEALSVEEPEEAPPASSELQTPEEARSALDEQGIDYTQASLFERVRAGDVSVVRLFIAAGMDINAQDNDGWTALMHAAQEGHVGVVRLLLERGADINAQNEYGRTALVFAAWEGHVEVVRLLLEHGADINAQNEYGRTALIRAAGGGHVDVVRLLLEHGVDVNAQNSLGWTVVMYAAQVGHVEVVRLLLEHGADINAQNEYGGTAVMFAARGGAVDVVRLLLEHGADINAQDSDGDTALLYAAEREHVEVVRLLLEHGADINAQNNDGDTALLYAAQGEHVEVVRLLVRLLLERGADINARDEFGWLAVMYAARGGYVEVVRLLLEHEADINAQNEFDGTALIIAARRGHVEVVRFLLEHGADVNAQTHEGRTALIFAAQGEHVEVVRLLLEHGADVNARDEFGSTALSLARSKGHQEMIDLLEAAGATE